MIKTVGKPEVADKIVVVFKYANGMIFSDVGFADDYEWVEDYNNKLIETYYIETYKLGMSKDFVSLENFDNDTLVYCLGTTHDFVDKISNIDFSRFAFNKVIKFSILNLE